MFLIYRHVSKDNLAEGQAWRDSSRQRNNTELPSILSNRLERQLLLKLLAMNSNVLSDDFKPEDLAETEKAFRASFILPIGSLSFEARGKLNEDQGCVICGQPSKSRCTQCQSVYYCSKGMF